MAQAVDFKGLPPVFKLKRIGESWGKWEMKIPIGNKLPIGGGAGAVHVQAAIPPPVSGCYTSLPHPTTSTPACLGVLLHQYTTTRPAMRRPVRAANY